ncbi:predicted protein [Naegleria gruberi]|uniref:V-type proton ATPase subunit a n=1 Tax=Naegleria gruberi TaxID=5762 RepID=D2W1Z5_NAEGR|nr:uncharacterized protein NAEGRDRAFT_75402 [Naegleria gruberi]EFC36897.1 predicted protein [Naegleria gruberi]|eukprot:XP_002669641.1 predicted protein [Naegleria gruberi strain NEG-M]
MSSAENGVGQNFLSRLVSNRNSKKDGSASSWRSETMVLLEMTMQREVAHRSVERLGQLGLVEFKDLSSHLNGFQRHYANEVKRCEDLERIIRFFEQEMEKSNVKFVEESDKMNGDVNELQEGSVNLLDRYEREFVKLEAELRNLSDGIEQLVSQKSKAEEFLQVIELAGNLDGEASEESQSGASSSMLNRESQMSSLGCLTGVIPSEKVSAFNMLIYRSTRGNAIPKLYEISSPIYDSKLGKTVSKLVFTVFFGSSTAKEKIKKICEAMGATIYDIPSDETPGESSKKVNQQVRELEMTIENSKSRLLDLLSEIASNMSEWNNNVFREKAIYHTLNMFNYDIRNSVVALGWVAERHVETVRREMEQAMFEMHVEIPTLVDIIHTDETPPTFFETNKFTEVFQQIVNSYGIPNYKEMNPAVASVIFFPFLFSVMFGDFGHGLLLSIFSFCMIIFERRLKPIAENNELLAMIFQGRYILILMGLFSIYTGFLYNDGFGLSVDLFPTAFNFDQNGIGHKDESRTYPFGIDPGWFHTSNKLLFYNSLKMKMAIIFGVGHMTAGLLFSLVNMIQFGHFLDIFLEFIPELLILWCTFGYMSIMIVYKWCVNWGDETHVNIEIPQLLPTMTDFFLSPWKMSQPPLFYFGGSVEEAQKKQTYAQLTLLLIAVISVPILLIPKPVIEYYKQKRKLKKVLESEPVLSNSEEESHEIKLDETKVTNHAEIEPFSELFIKQLIHTIEYVLNTVSNTASYLRLWALSLAHAQLSEVFWQMTLGILLNSLESYPLLEDILVHYGIGVFFLCALWFGMTIGVLLIMESLSAFLHAIRLTWIEFQGKFFGGTGSLFQPFSFETFGKTE